MTGETCDERQILEVSGADRSDFLQGLVTNDVAKLADGLVYAALLSPQGKYLADFFLVPWGESILIDVDKDLAPALFKRLNMYRLRADVNIAPKQMSLSRGLGDTPDGAFADPRHPGLGWRAYDTKGNAPSINWDALRVAHKIPQSGIELIPDDSYILEMGFERLNGVDFKKGCYVGQEVTARMKHKTELRKGLAQVTIEGTAPAGTPITSDGKPAGTLHTSSDAHALAYLRFDRAKGTLKADTATITVL